MTRRLKHLIPPRRGSLEPSPRGPFGLSALYRFVLLLDFFGFPLGTRLTYCVVGGGWGVFFKKIGILFNLIFLINNN